MNTNSTITILIGSKNPVKIQAAKEAFAKYFHVIHAEGISVPSGVKDQPMSKEETYLGAKNRVHELRKLEESKNADFLVAIEGGAAEECNAWCSFGAAYIENKEGVSGLGASAHFPLPKQVVDELKKGKELGIIMDEITGKDNTKHKEGAIGFLTNNRITRTELYIPALISALIPILNKELFEK